MKPIVPNAAILELARKIIKEHASLPMYSGAVFCEECSDDERLIEWPCDAVHLARMILGVDE